MQAGRAEPCKLPENGFRDVSPQPDTEPGARNPEMGCLHARPDILENLLFRKPAIR